MFCKAKYCLDLLLRLETDIAIINGYVTNGTAIFYIMVKNPKLADRYIECNYPETDRMKVFNLIGDNLKIVVDTAVDGNTAAKCKLEFINLNTIIFTKLVSSFTNVDKINICTGKRSIYRNHNNWNVLTTTDNLCIEKKLLELRNVIIPYYSITF